MLFKLNHDRRCHIPRQKRRVTNSATYDAALRQCGSLTVWLTDEAIAGWQAELRTTSGGQPCYSPLAILTGLTLRAVFRLALRQTEGFCQGSCQHGWFVARRPAIAPALVGGADGDAVCQVQVEGGDRAARAHRSWLPQVPLP